MSTPAERETAYITHVLGLVGGNKSHAARILGVDRRTLHRELRRPVSPVETSESGLT